MKALFILLASFLPFEPPGYVVEGDNVVFLYKGEGRSVVVSGNFNQWSKNDTRWTMKFDEPSKSWKLIVPKTDIKRISGSFYEFTFRVDGVLIDANKNDDSVIHCQGYGYRYVIKGI
jgi:hypothetical protein